MMSARLLDTLKAKAGQMAYGSFLYDWSLQEDAPDRLSIKPVDAWGGDAERGFELLQAAQATEETGAQWCADWWEPEDADEKWLSHINGFEWLRDLRAVGGALAREQGRLMIENWIARYPAWDAKSWVPHIAGRRLAMWIAHYDFFCIYASEEFEDAFMASLAKQAKHLHNTLGNIKDLEYFDAVKGLLYAGLAIEAHRKWADQALVALMRGLSVQILEDGGHVSRSPAQLYVVLRHLADMKGALKAADWAVPEVLEETIGKMCAAARFFRYSDRKLAVFHGTQEHDAAYLDTILAQCGARGKVPNSLAASGFERIEMGRSLIVFDAGKSPDYPFDKLAHAAPLAFEMSYGKDRLLVSCGAHPSSESWGEALRFTAAHNTATLDYRNACEIRKDGHFGRKVTEYSLSRVEADRSVLLEASHNGYETLNGIVHARRLFLGQEGADLRGQDDFSSRSKLAKPVDVAIRFHLHPRVSASLINHGQEILLRMPGSVGWRFSFSQGILALEESLYLGSGVVPQKTKQMVIYGQMSEATLCVKWALKREC